MPSRIKPLSNYTESPLPGLGQTFEARNTLDRPRVTSIGLLNQVDQFGFRPLEGLRNFSAHLILELLDRGLNGDLLPKFGLSLDGIVVIDDVFLHSLGSFQISL